jgi:type IV pilus assembly protein PilP
MKRADLLQLGAYVLVASASVGLAFTVALKFMGRSHAQDEQMQSPPPPPQPTGEEIPPSAPAPPPAGAPPAPESSEAGGGLAELEGFLEPFIYDMVNRRDPFMPYAEFVPHDDQGPSRPMSPAQRWALEELKLVGVMWDVKDPKAMFMDPDKDVLMLGRDESIGNRNGYIAAIREGEVVVVEAIRKRGDIIYRTRVLRIER